MSNWRNTLAHYWTWSLRLAGGAIACAALWYGLGADIARIVLGLLLFGGWSAGLAWHVYRMGHDAGEQQGQHYGFQHGHAAGYQAGHDAGHATGTHAGYREGYDKGLDAGWRKSAALPPASNRLNGRDPYDVLTEAIEKERLGREVAGDEPDADAGEAGFEPEPEMKQPRNAW